MPQKFLIKRENQNVCWWCGSTELTGEHKFKKTDLERLYGKDLTFKNKGVSLINYRSDKPPKNLQSPKSVHAQFEKSLCRYCNNSKSQPFDIAYDELIRYYLRNKELIKSQKSLNFSYIYGNKWMDRKINLSRYIMKHIGCRLAEHNLLPFHSTIDYLDGYVSHKHLKIVIQIKPYNILENETLYKGPFIPISHGLYRTKVSAICGWFSINNITFNYIYEWEILNNKRSEWSILPVEIVDYSPLQNKSFSINSERMASDFGLIVEELEYFPFTAELDEIKIYEYFRRAPFYL